MPFINLEKHLVLVGKQWLQKRDKNYKLSK